MGTAASYTTVETDVTEGLANALALLEAKTGPLTFAHRYACSSAAGGLRMMASGLVPELTAQAAREASLGAGAKVLKTYSFQLTEDDAEEIAALKPDIFLLWLAAPTARACSASSTMPGVWRRWGRVPHCRSRKPHGLPAVPADSRRPGGSPVYENVMPRFGVLNIEPAQKAIPEVSAAAIVARPKRPFKTDSLLSGISAATPSSVMRAQLELLSTAAAGRRGRHRRLLLAVDVGGATTDVYSVSEGAPTQVNTVCKGLPEPFVKRTVGDIGMRYSVRGILDAAGPGKLSRISGLPVPRVAQLVQFLREHTDTLPGGNPELEALDRPLASCAIETAVTRHAGTIEEAYTLMGLTHVQTGRT
ncbi:MAG: glutamate mutase L [Oscillospiraceae bacterium]